MDRQTDRQLSIDIYRLNIILPVRPSALLYISIINIQKINVAGELYNWLLDCILGRVDALLETVEMAPGTSQVNESR